MARPVALVTGARRGIGRAIAKTLAEGGFDLALFDCDSMDDTDAACRERGAATLTLQGDLSDLACHGCAVAAVADRFGRLDCLINNAGIGAVSRGDMLDLAPENFDAVIAVNLRGTMFLTNAVVRWMLAHPGPHTSARSVITLTSVSAEMANPERVEYCVSKAALSMWLRALTVRLAAEGIGVFEIRPGIIRTGMTAPVAARYDERIAAGLVPSGRWGEPEDVATAVLALAQPGLNFATGTILHVDGALAVSRF